MKKTTFFRKKIWFYVIAIFFGTMSCTEKFVVVSDTNAYHVKSGKVFSVEYDSSLNTYEQFTLTKQEYKDLLEARYGDIKRDSIQLYR